MDKQSVIASIRKEKEYLNQKFGVVEIGLFGSYARSEQTPESDIDVLVELKQPSYNALMGVYFYLEQKLDRKIDILRKGPHLSETFMNVIKKDLIYV